MLTLSAQGARMCMIDYGYGTVRMLENARLVTAIKRHKCAECWRKIEVGEKCHREKFVFDDEFTTHKTCAHCMVVRNCSSRERQCIRTIST